MLCMPALIANQALSLCRLMQYSLLQTTLAVCCSRGRAFHVFRRSCPTFLATREPD